MANSVGVFCPTLNVCGGGEFVAVAIANTLAASGRKVVFFANAEVDVGGIRSFFGEKLNPSIQEIKQPTNFRPRSLPDFYQTILHNYVAKSKCNYFVDVFSNCVFPWTNISYVHYPYLNRQFFNQNFPYLGNPHFLQAGTAPYVLLEKNLVSYSDKLILANSRYTALEIRRYSGKTVEVLYPPFSKTVSEIAKRTTKDASENLVVTVSRIEPSKLLERIPKIAAQTDAKIKFAIVGRLCSNETLIFLQETTKKLGLEERVKFYPDASAETKIDLLRKAKIYLHTMEGEHFGISTVEAMALGCLPIVHNSGGMKEFVPDQYRYDNLQEAADKIASEIGGWSTEKSGDAQRISEKFSMENFSLKFLDFYNKFYD
jgi:glycosyltransferase involved in cell wall biosynthesis